MARLVWTCALVALACAEERATISITAPTVILVSVEGGVVTGATLKRAPFTEQIEAIGTLHVLEYDAPLDGLLITDDQGTVTLAQPNDESWPLPQPDRRQQFPSTAAPLDLAGLAIERPPCRDVDDERIPFHDSISSLVGLGDGALIGTRRDSGATVLYRGTDGAFETLLTFTSTSIPGTIEAFADARGASVWAPLPGEATRFGLYDIAPDRRISAPRAIEPAQLHFSWIAGARFGDARTIIARPGDGMLVQVLDESTNTWTVAYDANQEEICGSIGPLIFEIPSKGRAIAGVGDGRIIDIDLLRKTSQVAEGFELPRRVCRNGLLTYPSGAQILFFEEGGEGLVLWWRKTPSAPWESLYGARLVPTAFAMWGSRAVMALGKVVLLFEHEARHPSLPPRVCGPYDVNLDGNHLLPLGDEVLIADRYPKGGSPSLSVLRLRP